jgi:hypothetical protein
MTTQLEAAEQELYEWAIGQRSFINEQMSVEGESRGETLVLTAQRDAAEIQAAYWRVMGLRLLGQVEKEAGN